MLVSDVNGAPVEGAELRRSIWSGSQLETMPPLKISSDFLFDAGPNARNIVCELRHPQYAPLVISMLRNPSDQVWTSTNPTRQVLTSGQNITVGAVLGRLRWAPARYVPEDQLTSKAGALKGLLMNKVRADPKAKDKPYYAPQDDSYRAVLTTQDGTSYRRLAQVQHKIPDFHVATPDLVGVDPTQPGWGHFAFQTASVDPANSGSFYLTEFGEVAADLSAGPRFLVGVWVPNGLGQLGLQSVDFILWLHPATTTNPNRFPQDSYPYRTKYPYPIWAGTENGASLFVVQRYADIPIHHLYDTHFLVYQMEAARRNAVIVAPVGPSGSFGPLTSQSSLFRLLRELCFWMPRGDPKALGTPARFPPPPQVGRVAVAAFSSSVPYLQTLIESPQTVLPYAEKEWGAGPIGTARFGVATDNRAFDSAWSEIWAIDGVASGFPTFVERTLTWFKSRSDRFLRIYKSTWTGGWDLQAPASTQVKEFVTRGRTVERRSGDAKAVVVQDPGGRWTFASMTNEFMCGPKPAGPPSPQLDPDPDRAHEMMPRVLFGHAVGSSGFPRF